MSQAVGAVSSESSEMVFPFVDAFASTSFLIVLGTPLKTIRTRRDMACGAGLGNSASVPSLGSDRVDGSWIQSSAILHGSSSYFGSFTIRFSVASRVEFVFLLFFFLHLFSDERASVGAHFLSHISLRTSSE
ncbi:hypothetical protein Tco_0264494 [Tanacetum coccineum]